VVPLKALLISVDNIIPQRSGGGVSRARHSGLMDTPPLRWKERYKRNVARIRSGLPDQIELVVDELTERDATCGLSQGENRMLKRAVEMLRDLGFDA
jgi:RNA polymerase-interacting CarD/CdnL/TRCF family regulator